MDQSTVILCTTIFGSGGAAGAIGQWIALRKEKEASKKWRTDMEARLSKIEDDSPTALMRRFEEVEGIREEDKREFYRAISGLRVALREALNSLADIQNRLKIPSV